MENILKEKIKITGRDAQMIRCCKNWFHKSEPDKLIVLMKIQAQYCGWEYDEKYLTSFYEKQGLLRTLRMIFCKYYQEAPSGIPLAEKLGLIIENDIIKSDTWYNSNSEFKVIDYTICAFISEIGMMDTPNWDLEEVDLSIL